MAGDSKTEKATPKKRRDERKKGNVFQSKDVITAFSILAIFFTLKLIFPFIYNYMKNFLIKYIGYIKTTKELTPDFLKDLVLESILALFLTAGPIMLVAMAVGIVGSGVQTKFIFSADSIKPKFSRISIGKGIKRLFALRSVMELIKSIIKITVIIVVLYVDFLKIIHEFPKLMSMGVESGTLYIFDKIMNVVIKIVLVFGVIAFFDYLYQWWDYEKNLKMSKQEIKEEYKHMEGDPEVKGKIKQKQRQLSTGRMMQAVPTADVIIRNPTHFAVALKYDLEKDMAPMVVAKGQDHIALKIIEIAKEHNIPMTENRPLARALYETVEPNMPIPPEFYSVLAEIMAWVYTVKKKGEE